MSLGSHILLKIISENRFSGKTYFYTIASSILKEYMKQLLGNPIDLGGDVLPLKKLDREAIPTRGRKGTFSRHNLQ